METLRGKRQAVLAGYGPSCTTPAGVAAPAATAWSWPANRRSANVRLPTGVRKRARTSTLLAASTAAPDWFTVGAGTLVPAVTISKLVQTA